MTVKKAFTIGLPMLIWLNPYDFIWLHSFRNGCHTDRTSKGTTHGRTFGAKQTVMTWPKDNFRHCFLTGNAFCVFVVVVVVVVFPFG